MGDDVRELLDASGETVGVDEARLDQRADELPIGAASEAIGDGHDQLRGARVVDLGEQQCHRVAVIEVIGDLLGAKRPCQPRGRLTSVRLMPSASSPTCW